MAPYSLVSEGYHSIDRSPILLDFLPGRQSDAKLTGRLGFLDAVVGDLVAGCEVIGQIRFQSHRARPVRKVEPATHAGRDGSWLPQVILDLADDPIWAVLKAAS